VVAPQPRAVGELPLREAVPLAQLAHRVAEMAVLERSRVLLGQAVRHRAASFLAPRRLRAAVIEPVSG
jgi:hypothetical protein